MFKMKGKVHSFGIFIASYREIDVYGYRLRPVQRCAYLR